MDSKTPVPGKVYALTGAAGDKCISNGNSWAESEVKESCAGHHDSTAEIIACKDCAKLLDRLTHHRSNAGNGCKECDQLASSITMKEWQEKGDFSEVTEARKLLGQALPMQVDEDVYDEFLGVLPPEEMGTHRNMFHKAFGIHTDQYFLVGEPAFHKQGRPVYATFAKYDGKFWFLGYSTKS